GDRLGPQGRAQTIELADEVRHVTAGVAEDEALERLEMGQRIFDREPAAPRMAQQVHSLDAERLADCLHLLDVAANRPKRLVLRPGGGTAAELIIGDDTIAVIDQADERLPQVIARQSGAAVQ